jgi:hypothetical protein
MTKRGKHVDDELRKWLKDIQRDLDFLRKFAWVVIGYGIGSAIAELVAKSAG